jgi:predicted Fe-S protein YdhL (DUF1289 family)
LNDSGFCVGCKRSMAEIIAWATMSAAEQQAVMQLLDRRQL